MDRRAAILRTRPLAALGTAGHDPRIQVSMASLRALDPLSRGISFLPNQPARSVLNGRHASRIRGRGLDFEDLREYQPSDDVRSIDWKVTARSGKPYVRVYSEERERPALIVVDQRMSMFFGTKLNTKAVTAAECAAVVGFRILDQGDRVGGIVFGDDHIAEIRPKRSRAVLTRLLGRICDANALLHANAPDKTPMAINTVLQSVQRIASRDFLVIVISDFDAVDARTRYLMRAISQRNDLVLGLVTDPAAQEFPKGELLTASDGVMQAQLDLSDEKTHHQVQTMTRGRVAQVLDYQNHMRVSILPLSTAEETLPQMQRLLGCVRP